MTTYGLKRRRAQGLLTLQPMADRRRANRFVSPGTQGTLRLLQDVRIEHAEPESITVLACERPVASDQLIQLRDCSGRRAVFRVRPIESAVVSNGDVLRHRVKLHVVGPEDQRGRRTQVPTVPPGSIGVLVRSVDARAVNVSSTGCCLELAEQVGEGLVAMLDILGIQRGTGDAVRLCRAARVPGGAWPWSAAAEFLPLDTPGPTSMRSVAARLEALMDSRSLVVTRNKSASDQTEVPREVDLSDVVGDGLQTKILNAQDRTT